MPFQKLVGQRMSDADSARVHRASAEALDLNQAPSNEHEIGDWLNTIQSLVDEAVEAVETDPEVTDARTMRDNLLAVAAVAIAAAASMEAE